jgi:hypothetical protein
MLRLGGKGNCSSVGFRWICRCGPGKWMTLILTALAPPAVIHVSDRFVSRALSTGGHLEHDAFSNKTVVVVAEHCWLVLGYTGQAYFGQYTTDQLLASAISSVDLSGTTTFGTRFNAEGVDYREVIRRVAAAIRPATTATTVSIAGYFDPKNQDSARQLFVDVIASADGHVHVRPRIKQRSQPLHYNHIHPVGWVDKAVTQDISSFCQSAGDADPETVRGQLVELLMRAGSRDIPVGQDTMSVVLYPYEGKGQIKFRSADPVRQADIMSRSSGGDYRAYAGYCTPYVLIGGGAIWEPSIATRNATFGQRGGATFEVSGFDTNQPPDIYVAPQDRTPPPSR